MRKPLFPSIFLIFWRVSMVLILLFPLVAISVTEEAHITGPRPLMRFPDIHRDLIVFVYAEDIWSVSAEVGVASRLTIHDGEERFPKISPDGL